MCRDGTGKRVTASSGGHREAVSTTATTKGMTENGVMRRHGEAPRANSLLLHGLPKDEVNELCKSTLSSRVDAVSQVSCELEWIIRAICREELLKYGKFHVSDETKNAMYRQVGNMMEDCQVQNADKLGGTVKVNNPENRQNITCTTRCYSKEMGSNERTEVEVEPNNETIVKKHKVYSNAVDVEDNEEFRWYAGELNKRVYHPDRKNRKVTLENGKDEMNVPVKLLFGEDSVNAQLLLDTGAQRSFVSQRLYQDKLAGRTNKHHSLVRMYGVSGQELATSGEVELDVQIGDDIVRQKFIVADIREEGILGFDFCKNHQAEWRWRDNQLKLGAELGENDGSSIQGRVARITLKQLTVIPAKSEIVTSGILEHAKDCEEIGLIQPQSKFLEAHQIGVAAVLARKEENSVPMMLINTQDQAVILTKNTQVAMYVPAEIIPEIQVRASSTEQRTWDPTETFGEDVQELSQEEKNQFYSLIKQYEECFMTGRKPLGQTNVVKHHIHTGNNAPIKQRPRREPLGMKNVVKEEIDKMIEQGVIEPSSSAWASPIVLVKKKDGSIRFCVDYRKLNNVTTKDAYPLPRIEDNLDALKGAKFFSTLDLISGYWQVEMAPEDKEKTAFCTKYGLFQFKVMPFGLSNAPGTFERLMETVLRGMQWERAVLYLDDIIVFSDSIEEHLKRLEEILQRLRAANLMLKPKKCHFFKRQVEFLGHIVSQDGVRTDPQKVEAIKEWPIPRRVRDVRAFLGLTGYYRRFIQDYGKIAKPLHELTEKNTEFNWTKEREQAFQKLKNSLMTAPILGYPSTEEEDVFLLDTDASNCHIGAVLSQRQGGEEKVIAYGSKVLSKSERNYCVTRRELLAVVHFIRQYRHYLLGRKFELRTDHGALAWLFKFKEPEGQVARWLEALSEYNFTITHRAGKAHGNGDGLSRRPCPDTCPTCKKGEIRDETVSVKRILSKSTRKSRTTRNREKSTIRDVHEGDTWIEVLKKAQREDECLKKLDQWVLRPSYEEISGEKPELKIYWSKWNQLQKKENLWRYRWLEGDTEVWKTVVPEAVRNDVLAEHHDIRMAGHFGIQRTLERLRASPYYWPQMKDSVEVWIKTCDVCQRTKPEIKRQVAPMGRFAASSPLERVAVDVMGPFKETVRGNRFVIVIGDYFTKWMEAYPVPNHKAETVATTLVDNFFSRFGIPQALHSDQGRDFESKLFQDVCRILDIDKTRTTPWHPQSDGMVERFNRTLQTLLKQTIQQNQEDWDQQIAVCCMAYRSSVHDVTKKTPNMLMLGRELPLPSHLLLRSPEPEEKNKTVHEYATKLHSKLQKSHEEARRNSLKGMRHQKKQYDRRAVKNTLQQGQFVWLYNPTKKVGLSPKLQVQWEDKPYEVVKLLSDLVVQLKQVGTQKKRVVHRNQVKLVGDQEKWIQYQMEKRTDKQSTVSASTGPDYVLNARGFPIRA